MAVRRLLLDTLDDLIKDDLERFQWGLVHGVLDGCKPIPSSHLEDARQIHTVDVMTQQYGEEMAVNVTVENLKTMGNNDAAEKLKNKYAARGNTAAASTSAAAPPAAAPAAPPAVVAAPAAPPAVVAAAAAPPATMMAQQGGVIIAPTVAGGTSGTWNITVNK